MSKRRNTVLDSEADALQKDEDDLDVLGRQIDDNLAQRRRDFYNASAVVTTELPNQSADKANDTASESKEVQAAPSQESRQEAAEQKDDKSADSERPLTTDERLDLLEKQLGLTQAELQDRDATIDSLKRKIGSYTGEIGHLRKRVAEAGQHQSQSDNRRDLLAESAEDFQLDSERNVPQGRELSGAEKYLLKTAGDKIVLDFSIAHPDVVVTGDDGVDVFHPEFRKVWKGFQQEYEVELTSGDFDKVTGAVKDILRQSYARFDRDQKKLALEDARKRRTAAVTNNQRSGLASAITNSTGSGGSQSTGNRAKSLEEMSLEELGELIDKDPNRRKTVKLF